MTGINKRTILLLVLALAVTAVLFVAAPAIKNINWLSFGYAGVFLVMLVSNATVIFPVPGLAVASLFAFALNPWLAGLYGGLGAGLGEITGYLAGYGGTAFIEEKKIKQYARIKKWIHSKNNGLAAIFILSVIPNPFFDLAGIAAGSAKYPWQKFLLACIAGKIIQVTIIAHAVRAGYNFLF
ncbi:VTT domain-containing protein [Candidatus Micrarchaeota archaeon]|nr:VTT domain-containing protein [Candidatus Micrarchaeota archaeon]